MMVAYAIGFHQLKKMFSNEGKSFKNIFFELSELYI